MTANNGWAGGLPPVGGECQFWHSGGQWAEGVCVAHDQGGAVIRHGTANDTYTLFSVKCLRPVERREPKPGECWLLNDRVPLLIAEGGYAVDMEGGYRDIPPNLTFAADTLRDYHKQAIAREFLALAEEFDGGHTYHNSVKLAQALHQAVDQDG